MRDTKRVLEYIVPFYLVLGARYTIIMKETQKLVLAIIYAPIVWFEMRLYSPPKALMTPGSAALVQHSEAEKP